MVGLWVAAVVAVQSAAPTRTVKIPMRDGVKLATDIYLPDQSGQRWPCLLIRTPYDRTRYDREYGAWARGGCVVAIQDTRGRFGSEGKAMAFQSDAWGEQKDGYDTVEWLAKQDFCNGKVGTVGASAMGIVQVMMAPTAPPSLVCQYISVAPASLFHEAMYVGGVFRKSQVENWMKGNAHPDALRMALDHGEYDDFWAGFDTRTVAGRVTVPAVHYGGWFDTFSEGTLNNFKIRQESGGPGARGTQKLVMGPWTHGGQGKREFGDFELPPEARRLPAAILARSWFDFWLRSVSNGVDKLPAVHYYVMGPFDGSPSSGNRWKTADAWPVPAKPTPFYAGADGMLAPQKAGAAGELGFVHNPTNPVPTVGGRNLVLPAGPKDQRKIERRPDVLVFSTPPLEQEIEIAGKVIARVHLAAGIRETHLAARLCDVYPDGRSILIAEGIQRIRLPADNTAGNPAPVAVDVDLWSTSIVFTKGHRIRLSLSGSNYPRWETSKPLGDQPVLHRIFVGGNHATQLILPVVE